MVDAIGAARGLFDLVDSHADQAERIGTLPQEVVAALHDADLYRLLVPAEAGGGQADLHTAMAVVEEISRADGSAGWSYMAAQTTLAIAGAFFPDEAVEKVFVDPQVLTAGQVAPLGTAHATDGGYRIAGRFGFCSGANDATWIFGGYRELDADGKQIRLPNGLPSLIVGLLPKDRVEMADVWDVIGLVATASYDYTVPEQQIEAAFTFPFFAAETRRGGALYDIGANGLTCLAHSAFALGVARRALDEIAAIALVKRRPARGLLVDDDTFQLEYGRAEAALAAARASAYQVMDDLTRAAHSGALTMPVRARARLATNHACETAAQIAKTAYHFAGAQGLKNPSRVQRCYRDMSAGEQHLFTDVHTYIDAGSVLLGRAPETMFL